jgi:hypothetical protein
MTLKDIELRRINFADDRFRISYFADLEKLKQSIANSGLLSPIILSPRGRDLVIAAGWRRALACRDLSLSPIPCFICEETEDLKVFLLAVLENLAARDFHILEKAVILQKLKSFGLSEMILLDTYCPLFGIPQTLSHLDAYLVMAEFDSETKDFIHTKNVSYPVIPLLMELNNEERSALLPHLKHLGQNKQKEFLEFLLETSKRDNISVLEILASGALANAINSTSLSPFQKADKIRLLLKKRRYPSLSAQKDAFESSLKKIDWPRDIAIDHSPFFEGEDISIRFTFTNSIEFKEKVQRLQTIASANRIAELLKSLSND